MLHGRNGNGEAQASLANVAAGVAASGYWAVLPLSRDNQWEDDPTVSLGYDDVGYVRRILDIMGASFGIDSARVYASGMSEGGFMAQRLACQLSDRIAAFAMVASTMTGKIANVCAPTVRRPLMLVHGSSDQIVPWNGYLGVLSVDATVAKWTQLNQCPVAQAMTQALPDSASDGTTVNLTRYPGCAGGTELRLYRVNNGGHTWPGGQIQYQPASIVGNTSMDIKATTEIWNFVSPYRR
jgi:polyhydroxybutyrate depolymerase